MKVKKTGGHKSWHGWQTKCPCGPFLIGGKYVKVQAGCWCGAKLGLAPSQPLKVGKLQQLNALVEKKALTWPFPQFLIIFVKNSSLTIIIK